MISAVEGLKNWAVTYQNLYRKTFIERGSEFNVAVVRLVLYSESPFGLR